MKRVKRVKSDLGVHVAYMFAVWEAGRPDFSAHLVFLKGSVHFDSRMMSAQEARLFMSDLLASC